MRERVTKGQCLCEVRHVSSGPWVPCDAGVVPDSPFCAGCEGRHTDDKEPEDVRVRKIKVSQ